MGHSFGRNSEITFITAVVRDWASDIVIPRTTKYIEHLFNDTPNSWKTAYTIYISCNLSIRSFIQQTKTVECYHMLGTVLSITL